MILTLLFVALAKPRLIRVPLIARFPGMIIGATSVEEFERRYLPGEKTMGGHPRGGRLWYDRTLRAEIGCDGFYFAPNGRIIDGASVDFAEPHPEEPPIPEIRIRKSDLGMFAVLKHNMSRMQVEAILHHKLVEDKLSAAGLVRFSEKLVNKDNDHFTNWHATFDFGPNGLTSAYISAQ